MTEKKLRAGKIIAATLLLVFMMGLLDFAAALAPEAVDVVLTVRQAFIGASSASPNETFVYRLTPKSASNPMPAGSGSGGYTFSVAGADEIEIGPIRFAQPGIYAYELSCISNEADGYILDRQKYGIDVHVKSNLTAAVVVHNDDGTKASEIYFGHMRKIEPSDPALMADPSVVKTVSGNPAAASTFFFRLTAEKLSNPMPQGSQNGVKTISITGSGWGEFGTWSYTQEGIYYYTVSEQNTNIPGYDYDTAVYTITDTVKAVEGQLVLSRIITNSANRQVTSFMYLNTYKGSGGPSNPPPPTQAPTEPSTQPTTDSATQATTQSPITEPTTEFSTRPATDSSENQPPTEPSAQPATDSATQAPTQAPTESPIAEPTMEPSTQPATNSSEQQPPTEPSAQSQVTTRPPPPPPVYDENGNELGIWVYDEENEEWVLELFPPLIGFPTYNENAGETGSKDKPGATATTAATANSETAETAETATNSNDKNDGHNPPSGQNTPTNYGPPSQNGPKTGDDSQAALYSGIFFIAAAAAAMSVVYLLACRRRRKEQG